MTAITKNLVIEQGTDYQRPFFLKDENGDPVDLTGCLAAMEVCPAIGLPPILTLTTANGGLVIGGATGTITPMISHAVTTNLVPGIYVYDVKLAFPSGRTVRPFQGSVTVSAEVTTLTLSPPSPPTSTAYTAEDGTTPYTGEDGTTPYNQES